MKNLICCVAVILCTVISGSAQRSSTTTTVRMQDTQARVLDASSSAYVVPLTVELEVAGARIRDVWPLTKEQAEVEMFGDLVNIRSWAVYMSSRKHNSDVIVAPTFNVRTNDAADGYDVEVVGFPAHYKNWSSATEADYEWIRMEKTLTTSDREKISAIIK